MPSHDYRPTAPPEVVSGYAYTARLAERRAAQVAAWGDAEEAAAWGQIAAYCREMAECRALDDDQFPGMQSRLRHRRERPLPDDVMDALAIRRVDTEDGPRQQRLSPWQEAVLRLALGYLTETQRPCYELVVGDRLSAREAAEALGITPAEARKRLSRARQTIEEKVRPRLEELARAIRLGDVDW